MLRVPQVNPGLLRDMSSEIATIDADIFERAVIEGQHVPIFVWRSLTHMRIACYEPHLVRQRSDVETFMEDEEVALNPLLDYASIEGLSSEVRERLTRVRPTSIVSFQALGVHNHVQAYN